MERNKVTAFLIAHFDNYASAELRAFGHFHIYDLVTLVVALNATLATKVRVRLL